MEEANKLAIFEFLNLERKVYETAQQFDSVDHRGLVNVDVRSNGGVEGEKSTFWSNNGIYQVFMHVIIR